MSICVIVIFRMKRYIITKNSIVSYFYTAGTSEKSMSAKADIVSYD